MTKGSSKNPGTYCKVDGTATPGTGANLAAFTHPHTPIPWMP